MSKIDIPHADQRQHDLTHFEKIELTAKTTGDSPFGLFAKWYNDAKDTESSDPNAMSLATINTQNIPNIRIVLLKDFSEDGFVFFTNYTSQKAQEIALNPQAALCFHWKSALRQIRIQGIIHKITEAESDAYFSTRDLNSQIGAWVSDQSSIVSGRQKLLDDLNYYQEKFKDYKTIPRPAHWGGYCLKPLIIEFWQNGAFRLHDRLVFSRQNTTNVSWSTKKLYP